MPVPDPRYLPATVTARTEISHDLWLMRIDHGGQFSFRAGQYATLGLERDGHLVQRAYSIASSPYEPELELFIELVPHGELTPLLYQLRPGDPLTLRRAAKGRFLLEAAPLTTDHLFLCTVTGVAPFLSLLRTLVRDWEQGTYPGDHRLFLIQGASHSSEFGYLDELQTLAGRVPWFTYVPTVSRPWADAAWPGETGRVDDVLRKYADRWFEDPSRGMAHLCGHPSMIEHGKAILERRGWAKERMKEESYFVLKAGA